MDTNQPKRYDISQLAELSGLTVRTIRYYVQQQLLPSSISMGPGASYPEEALARLLLIRQLQRENLSLAEIRERLGVPGDAKRPEAFQQSAAYRYAQSVLAGKQKEVAAHSMASPSIALPDQPRTTNPGRTQWERYSLTDNIEIHVRRPLNREDNRNVERLLEAARKIFKDKP
jgi:DNA-binding transcriptional MerR regulator